MTAARRAPPPGRAAGGLGLAAAACNPLLGIDDYEFTSASSATAGAPAAPVGRGGAGPCAFGEQESCYSGPAKPRGVGECADGLRTCDEQSVWGPCAGDVTPESEVCEGAKDENCDGTVDESCACVPGLSVEVLLRAALQPRSRHLQARHAQVPARRNGIRRVQGRVDARGGGLRLARGRKLRRPPRAASACIPGAGAMATGRIGSAPASPATRAATP